MQSNCVCGVNKVYLYNGEFEELLALIMTLLPLKLKNVDIKNECQYENNLLEETITINIIDKEKKLNYLYNTISKNIMHIIYYVYLSNNQNKENVIYYFILNTLIYKEKILNYLCLNCVNKAINISKYVGSEAHKLKGFTRFKKMKNNFYYAEIKPVNNVLLILANHFSKRLSNEYFLIKDVGRNIYAMYDTKNITILNSEDIKLLNLELDKSEKFMEELWKNFFNTIGIKERKNLKCQMNFMPKRYWEYMIEMEDKI